MQLHQRYLSLLILALFSYALPLNSAIANESLAIKKTATPPISTELAKHQSALRIISDNFPLDHFTEHGIGPRTENAIYMIFASAKDTPCTAQHEEGTADFYVKIIEALAKFLASVVWPIAAILMASYFKPEIAALISRMQSLKAGAAEARFSDEVNTVASLVSTSDQEEPEIETKIVSDAALNPRGEILNAWLRIERTINQLYQSYSQKNSYQAKSFLPTSHKVKWLRESGILSKSTVVFCHKLQKMRNQAAHDLDFRPDLDSVILYVKLAKELNMILENTIQKLNDSTHSANP